MKHEKSQNETGHDFAKPVVRLVLAKTSPRVCKSRALLSEANVLGKAFSQC